MPATIISKISSQPDLSITPGEISSVEFQDCMNIIQAFEKAAHYSATEESAIVVLAHPIQSSKYWAKANHEILSGRLLNTTLLHEAVNSLEVASNSPIESSLSKLKGSDFSNALKLIRDECIPCDVRVKFALEHLPSKSRLDMYSEDIRMRLETLANLDSALKDVSLYRDLCSLLKILAFMCPQDLQRMISVLMASMFKINLDMAGAFSAIVSLIMPIVMPVISGVINLLDQFEVLVLNPIDCVLDLLQVQNNSLEQLTGVGTGVGVGLAELSKSLIEGRDYTSSKLNFYVEVIKKAMTDTTGDTNAAIRLAGEKVKVVRLISLVISILNLRKKGSKLCEGENPTTSELSNFFSNFLNPNSFIQFTVDQTGNITVGEPQDPIFQIEEPNKGAKILNYEPDSLLAMPAQMTFKCAFHTSGTDIAKVNSWIEDLNRAG